MDKLKLEVLLAAIDKVTRPLKAIRDGSSETAKALKGAKDQLKALNDQQKNIDGFREAARGLAINRQELAKTEERVRSIKQAMEAAEFPTREMQKAFMEATAEANHLKGNITRLTERQERLRRELSASGADTHKLAGYQRELKAQMATATTEVDKQRKALDALNQRQNAVRAARYGYDKTINLRNRMAGGGATTAAAGVAMSMPIIKAIKDYASFEDAMMGVARQVDGAKDANGRYTQTYYDMGEAIKAMSERIPLATTEIAAIVEAGARMGIQGKANLLAYAETTAIMASAFDLPVDQVGEDVGKIAALYKVPIKSISELGDVINWLDDNAQSKGGDIIDVMKRIAGTADSVGMKYREAAALASTFLSLGANSEVAGSASNAMMTNLSIATMQSKKFQEGLAMLKMDGKSVQDGMSKDATGTILKVMDAIKSLPQEKQLEATTRLFGKEFGDDAAKLAANLGEYRRQLELTNAAQAKGSMQREADSRNQALSARYEMLKSTLFNVSSALGESLKPALVDIMQSTADVLASVRAWTKEHPELTANLVKGAAIIAVIVTGLGALTLAAAAVLGPLAALKFGLAMFPAAGAALSWLNPLAKLTAAFAAGYAIGKLIDSGISAVLSHFLGEGTTLGTAIYDLVQWIKLKLGELWQWFSALPARFIDAGKNLMIGLGDGILNGLGYVKAKITGAGAAVIGWFKEKLGIRSPSRVFAELGGFTMQGLEQGLSGGQRGPLDAVRATAKQLAAIGAGMTIGGAAMAMPPTLPTGAIQIPKIPDVVRNIRENYLPDSDSRKSSAAEFSPIKWDDRPPISQSASISQSQVAAFQPIINIYAQPGMDAEAIGRMVEQKLANLHRQQAANARSSLRDKE